MLFRIALIPTVILALFHAQLAAASTTKTTSAKKTSTSLVKTTSTFISLAKTTSTSTSASPAATTCPAPLKICTVYVQRWSDNVFDMYPYNVFMYPYDVGWANVPINQLSAVETTLVSAGDTLEDNLGSSILVITLVANPVDPTDAGKVSFRWGTQSWDNYSFNNPCVSRAVGVANASWSATQYTCYFLCDA